MKNFLRWLAILFAVVFSVSANAQEMAAGANLGVAFGDGISNFGVGAKFRYTPQPISFGTLRGEASFNYFVGTGSYWDLGLNAHYLISIPNVPQLKVYPLLGLAISGFGVTEGSGGGGKLHYHNGEECWGETYFVPPYSSADCPLKGGGGGGSSSAAVGINIGVGGDYKLPIDNLYVTGELRYRAGNNWNRFVVSVGVAYKF